MSNLISNAHYHDFLVEIHTEELPPKALSLLANRFSQSIQEQLSKANLHFSTAHAFSTPRRLAVWVKKLAATQPDTVIERKGPALDAAFDANQQPTPACLGFARSCGVEPSALMIIEQSPMHKWVGYRQTMKGKLTPELLPPIVQQALVALPIPKRMRWGNYSTEFVRPIHAIILLYGKNTITTELLHCQTGNKTQGHRFYSKKWITIKSPATYAKTLAKHYVIADATERREMIYQQILHWVNTELGEHARALINNALLDEVTALVEWPVAIGGKFDDAFLAIPQEALISVMQEHQRYFPVEDQTGKLLPYFITISNINSKNPSQLIAGNERVLRARLSDAAFFFQTDKTRPLVQRVENLKHIIFQAKLGSLYDKTQRLIQLATFLASILNINDKNELQAIARAALLAKADLTTGLVGEFPELQGIAGYYYALHDRETDRVADALKEHYLPRFAGDQLPSSRISCLLAIADRIDTLIGVFGIHQLPTGDKDPFGLRRAALGVVRILIEKKINLNLKDVLIFATEHYHPALENKIAAAQVLEFMLERLKHWQQEQGFTADTIAAVMSLGLSCPFDISQRIHAVQHFKQTPEASSLSLANKRVSHILAKYEAQSLGNTVDPELFEQEAEKELANALTMHQQRILSLAASANYPAILNQLAQLRDPIDHFFDQVLVMTEDKAKQYNRLLLLKHVRELFLEVADIALLQ